jgi:two-component system sensor histidine kinase PilS (NtrC family)
VFLLGPEAGGLGARALYRTAVQGAAFLLLAFLAGALAERSRRSRERLVSAEVELQRVLSSTEQIIEHMPIGVITATREGRIVRTNRAACEILAIDPEADLRGHDLVEFLGSFAQRLGDALEEALGSSAWSVREEILVKKGRREHPIGVSITPLRDEAGVPEGVIVTFTDLRELRHMEREMRRSEQLANLGELAAGVAHEIRNPLASISGAIQVLRSEMETEGQNAELMDLIIRESDRLNRTIAGMLDYTRDHSASRAVHDLTAIVRDVVRLISHDKELTMGKTILVEFPQGESFLAEVEEEGMRQVFFNLARNAMEAMGVGGILRISGEKTPAGRVRIVFRDTGVGIPPHELEHIFKPFHTSKPDGTGLGLSIATRIVEGNGGTIRARSTPGMGTAITVELPEASERSDRGSSRESVAPKRGRRARKRSPAPTC